MVRQRGVRGADPAGERPQAERRRAMLGDRGEGGVEGGAAQGAMVVRVGPLP
jgi:hypothetical protein